MGVTLDSMHPGLRAIATLLALVLGLQLGGEGARCMEGGHGVQPAAMTGAHGHDHGASPGSPGTDGCSPNPTGCRMMSHCAVAMILPETVQGVIRLVPEATPLFQLPAEPTRLRAAPTPPPPRA